VLWTAVKPELLRSCLPDTVAASDAGEAVLYSMPWIVLDDPQLGDTFNDPFAFRIDPR
jgi:hypothetical protein